MQTILFWILYFPLGLFGNILYAQDFSPVVRVHTYAPDNSFLNTGTSKSVSGAVISNDNGNITILSCAHIFFLNKVNNTAAMVSFYESDTRYNTYPCTIIKQDNNNDLSLILVKNGPKTKIMKLADDIPKKGTHINIFGKLVHGARGSLAIVSDQKVSTQQGDPIMRVNGTAISGLSGGPMTLMSNGSIVGVQVTGSNGTIDGARIDVIQKFIKDK